MKGNAYKGADMLIPAMPKNGTRKASSKIIESWMIKNLNKYGNCYIGTNIRKNRLEQELSKMPMKVNVNVYDTGDCVLELVRKKRGWNEWLKKINIKVS